MYLAEEQGESYLVRPRYKKEVDEGIPLIFKVNFEAVQKKGLDQVLVRVVVTEKFPLWGGVDAVRMLIAHGTRVLRTVGIDG